MSIGHSISTLFLYILTNCSSDYFEIFEEMLSNINSNYVCFDACCTSNIKPCTTLY